MMKVLKQLEYDDFRREQVGRDQEFAAFLFDNNPFQPPKVAFIEGRECLAAPNKYRNISRLAQEEMW